MNVENAKVHQNQTLDNIVVKNFYVSHVLDNVKPRFPLNAFLHLEIEGIFINEATGKAVLVIEHLKSKLEKNNVTQRMINRRN